MIRPLVALGALLLAARAASAQMPPPQVAVAAVTEAEVREGRTFVGTVMPVRTSRVSAEAAGYIVEFLVREGDRVTAGQPLARLRTTALDIQIGAARAELQLRQEELKELENGTRPEEIEQAETRLRAAEAEQAYWVWRLDGARKLFEAKTNSEDDIQNSISQSTQATERRADAAAALKLAREGPRPERVAQARARVAVQEQEVARLLDVKERHVVAAPFAGYVVKEHTQIGQWLAIGAPVAEIVEIDRVEIEAAVVEDAIARIAIGADAAVEVAAVSGERFVGKVSRIVSFADPRTRTFPVRILLENREVGGGALLKPGMLARVTLAVGEPQKAVLVPKDALVLGGPAPVIFIVLGGAATPVPVQLGVAKGSLIQVIGSVQPGQDVVVRGNERLQSNQAVVVMERLESDD